MAILTTEVTTRTDDITIEEQTPLLAPYIPRLVVEWLRVMPEVTHRSIEGTGVFADISGFTNLTERLARKGKVGAEEMGDVLNEIFEQLLRAAYEYGAGLVKWGGDAVLLLFEGDRHAEMACRAAAEMQRIISKIGRIRTSSGVVRLRMSIGIASGNIDFLLVGSRFRELIVTGPTATTVTQMETVAEAGEIVVSASTAEILRKAQPSSVGEPKGDGYLLAASPQVPRAPNRDPVPHDVDLRGAFSAPLRDHLLSGAVDNEHRQATVSFIEFHGTDDLLAQQGPEALTAGISHFINACQEAADANQVTFLSSDVYQNGGKVILISGAPRSMGDDDARILSATRQVIDAGGVLSTRAGINRGRLFAGDYGPSYRRCYSVTGDCVNLAARLMAKAEHHQIVASPAVLEHSRTSFVTTPIPPFMVKGKTEPIEAVLVGPMTELRATSFSELPLFGRERELAILLEAEASALKGNGQAIELVGPPGIGKSRLLEELIAQSSTSVLWTDGDIYGTAIPYQPLQRLFRQQLGLSETSELSEIGQTLAELVEVTAPHLAPWVPLMGIVAGADLPETPEISQLSSELRKGRLEAVTSEFLGLLLTDATTFIFNDVHFMDDASCDLLQRLALDVVNRPWLVIATKRPEANFCMADEEHVTRIELDPLDSATADHFLNAATEASPIPAHLIHALVERAGGNPLFLKELVANALDPNAMTALPDSVEELIAARIDRLEPERRRLLRAASVLGMTVDPDLLVDVLRGEDTGGIGAAHRIGELGDFLLPNESGHLQFAHHLIRETAYEGLPFSRRVLLHARTSDLLEERAGDRLEEQAALLSLHSYHGERYHAAWEYSRLAADRARSQYAMAEAAELFRRAIDSSSQLSSIDDNEVASVCELLADAYDNLAQFSLADAALAKARSKTHSDLVQTARLHLKTSTIRERMGQYSVALRWLSRGLVVVADEKSTEASRVKGELMSRYARIRAIQGKPSVAIDWARRAISESRLADDQSTIAHCLEYVDWAEMALGIVSDEPPAKRALDIYVELNELLGQANTHNTLGGRAYYQGRWNNAIDHYLASEAAFRKCGSIWGPAMPMASRGEILSDQGFLSEASTLVEEALRLARGSNKESDVAFCKYLLARIHARSGRFLEAFSLYEEVRQYYSAVDVKSLLVYVDGLEAECRLMAGQLEACVEKVDDALRRAEKLEGMATILPLLLRISGSARIALNQKEEGRRALFESLQNARSTQALHEVAFTLQALLDTESGATKDQMIDWKQEHNDLACSLGFNEVPAMTQHESI